MPALTHRFGIFYGIAINCGLNSPVHDDALWTPERMKRVIEAVIENDVAIEMNNRCRIPSAVFIKAAAFNRAAFLALQLL